MKRHLLWLALPLSALTIDLLSKVWVLSVLQPGDQYTVIKGFFYIKPATNSGAIFGIMQDAPPWLRGSVFLTAGIVALLYFGWEFFKSDTTAPQRCALGMILGGALGNGLDRLFRGHVVDFLDFWFGSWEYWIFNIADSFILCGAILFGITALMEASAEKKARNAASCGDESAE